MQKLFGERFGGICMFILGIMILANATVRAKYVLSGADSLPIIV